MNAQLLDQARGAYRSGDFSTAAQMFAVAKQPGDLCGEADHLRGNSLMRLGAYEQAAAAYGEALEDASYGKAGALLTNQGKAYLAAGKLEEARESFTAATRDTSYATPYKAHFGLGDALMRAGNPTEAGVAYRNAAIDGANPAPAAALARLGECFLAIGRPADAIESFRTAADFAGASDDTRAIDAALGQAYVAAGKLADAVEAFGRATADGVYQLTPEQSAALQSAQDSLAAQRSMAPAAAEGAPTVDPLDPLGKSGQFMPDPSDTGFFTLTESEMIQQDRKQQKVRRKKRHTGLKVFIFLLVVLLLAGGGLAFAYTRGLGYPSQQDTLSGLFSAVSDGTDTDSYLASALSDEAKQVLVSSVPTDATPTITGMDQGMTQSTADVKVELARGGSQTYEVSFVRDGLGWKVSNLSLSFGSTDQASTGEVSGDAGSAPTAQ